MKVEKEARIRAGEARIKEEERIAEEKRVAEEKKIAEGKNLCVLLCEMS